MATVLGSVFVVVFRLVPDGHWCAWSEVAGSHEEATRIVTEDIARFYDGGHVETQIIECVGTVAP